MNLSYVNGGMNDIIMTNNNDNHGGGADGNLVDVVVVGGGCAGLECASRLYTKGIKSIVVLEAQDYLGGRIKTTFINNDEQYPLEIGACWIHGYLGNPIYKLVLQNPTLFQHKKKYLFDTMTAYCADANSGRVVDQTLCERLWVDYMRWNAEAKTYWEEGQKSEFKNYAQFIMNRLNSHMRQEGDSDEMRRLKIAIVTRFLKWETTESGCSSMNMCSLNEYGSYSKPLGPDYEFPGGYSKLIEYLAKKLPESCIKLQHPVKHIRLLDHDAVDDHYSSSDPNCSADSVLSLLSTSSSSSSSCSSSSSATSNPTSYPILVECENGARFRTKHVVYTCSINYMKHTYARMFDHRLMTTRKINAIEACKMGIVNKIFLFYDNLASFFPDVDAVHPIFIENTTDACKSSSVVDDDDDSVSLSPNTPWYHKVFTFDRFYENMLMVWTTGWQAKYVEKLSDAEISRTLTDLLRRTLNNPNVPEPKRIVKTTWSSNPYVMGSYSYVDTKGSALTHINNLAEPIYIDKTPRILFAGEATHLRYYSTVHGAYLSGEREARRLLEFYSPTKSHL